MHLEPIRDATEKLRQADRETGRENGRDTHRQTDWERETQSDKLGEKDSRPRDRQRIDS